MAGSIGIGGLRVTRFGSGHQAKSVLKVTVLLKRAVINWIGRPAPGPWDSQRGDLRGGEPTDPKGGNDAGWGVLTTRPNLTTPVERTVRIGLRLDESG